MDDISASLEDYLEMIFILHRKGGEVRVTDIASSLKVSKPSVNRAVGALKEAGLPEEIAEEDACRMEHVVSAQTIQHLYDYLSRQEDGYEE